MEKIKLYNDEIELCFEEKRHLYTVDNTKVAGVTGVTGVLNKPALVYWAVNKAVEYLDNTLEPGKAYDEIQLKKLLEEAKFAHRKASGDAADIGTIVHNWIESYIKGENPEPPINEKLKKSTQAFVKWTEENDVKFVLSEKKVYSRKYNFAGTLDFTAYIGKRKQMVIGDVKTSTGVYPEMFFQTAAYQLARQEEHPEEKYYSNIIVRCGKDGTLEVVESRQYKKNARCFLGLLAAYNRQSELKNEEFKQLINSIEVKDT